MRAKEFDPDEVADAAMNVFWQRGYAATSIQDLVEGTGLSRSSLYSTFESKQLLYQRALERYESVTTGNVELLSGPGDVKDLIHQLLMRVVEDELKDAQQRGCLIANGALELAGHDEAVATHVSRNFQQLQKAVEKLIRRGQEAREIAADKDPRALGRFFVGTMQGLRVLSKGTPAASRRQCLLDVTNTALQVL